MDKRTVYICWYLSFFCWQRVSVHPDLISFICSICRWIHPSRSLVGSLCLNPTACCFCRESAKLCYLLLTMISFPDRGRACMEKLKGMRISIVYTGPTLRWFFQSSVSYWNIKREQSNPPFVFVRGKWLSLCCNSDVFRASQGSKPLGQQ